MSSLCSPLEKIGDMTYMKTHSEDNIVNTVGIQSELADPPYLPFSSFVIKLTPWIELKEDH